MVVTSSSVPEGEFNCGVFVVLVDDFRKLSVIRWIAAFYEFNDKRRTDVVVVIIVAVAFTDAVCTHSFALRPSVSVVVP